MKSKATVNGKMDIVVVGASAGGVTALQQLVANIPEDFLGSIFVVLHIPAHSPSNLPSILTSAGNLTAVHPKNGEIIKPGKIYCAPPDHHMLLHGKKILVTKGPKENRFRPSIDALFRSAAYTYGNRVIGVILSGVLNDGTSGLWSVGRLGGLTIIQDPKEASHPEMPLNVLEYVKVKHQLQVKEISALITKSSGIYIMAKKRLPRRDLELMELELEIAIRDNAFEMGIMHMGELTPFTCPECNGVLIQLVEGKLIRFRCHTGHAYTASALLGDLSRTVEDKLWQCMRGLEETSILLSKINEHFKKLGQHKAARIFASKAVTTREKARIIHDSIFHHQIISEDLRYQED